MMMMMTKMMMKPHQLLMLLLTLLLFVDNLPTCSSQFIFKKPLYLAQLREARREAFIGQPGGWRVINIKCGCIKSLVNKAAKLADVTSTAALQAFYKVGSNLAL